MKTEKIVIDEVERDNEVNITKVCKCNNCGIRVMVNGSNILATGLGGVYVFKCPSCNLVSISHSAEPFDPNQKTTKYFGIPVTNQAETKDIRDIKIENLEKDVSELKERLDKVSKLLDEHRSGLY